MSDLDQVKTLFANTLNLAEATASRLDALETRLNRPGAPTARHGGGGEAKADLTRDFRALALSRPGETKNAMMTGTIGPAGGFAVSTQIDALLSRLLRDISPARQLARVVQAQTSDFKVLVSTSGTTAAWAAEGQTRAPTASPDLARVQIAPGELYCYATTTAEILDDAAFDAEAFLREEIALAMAQAEGAAFVSGDGLNKPHGFLNVLRSDDPDATRAWPALQTVPAATTTGTTFSKGLIDLVYALKPAYRARGVFAMNAATAATIRGLADGQGRYLWAESLADRQPARLLGYPVVEVPDMPDVEADAVPVAFGDWQTAYDLVDVGQTRMVPDPVTMPGFLRLYMARRVGGAVTNSHALKLLRIGT